MGRTTGAILVVAVAILLLWMATTGRLNNLAAAWAAIRGAKSAVSAAGVAPTSGSASSTGTTPENLLAWLPPIGYPSTGNAPVIPVQNVSTLAGSSGDSGANTTNTDTQAGLLVGSALAGLTNALA